jgi:hypothetical protein
MSQSTKKLRSITAGALVVMMIFFDTHAAAARPCTKGGISAKTLNKQADRAFTAGNYLGAAQSWDAAAGTYPVCKVEQIGRRMEMIEAAVDGYTRALPAVAADPSRCEEPALLMTRMLVRHRDELASLAASSPAAATALHEIEETLAGWDPVIVGAAEILEGRQATAVGDLAAARDGHGAMVRRFPGCSAPLRTYLVQTTLASVPVPSGGPSCAAADVQARRDLAETLAAVAAARPAPPEMVGTAAISARLADYERPGLLIEEAQAQARQAAAAGDDAAAHASHALVLDLLPECEAYRDARMTALWGAVEALGRIGDVDAHAQAVALIAATQLDWEQAYGGSVAAEPWFVAFEALRRGHEAALPRPEAEVVHPPAPESAAPVEIAEEQAAKPSPAIDEPAVAKPSPASPSAGEAGSVRLVVGLSVSAGVTAAFILAGVVLTARVRRKGPIYADIVEAYGQSENAYVWQDLCDPATSHEAPEVAELCARHASVKRAAISMWVLASVAAVGTLVLGGLLARSSAGDRRNERRVTLGVAPERTGFMISGRLAF